METITKPKNHKYDIVCANVACAAVIRCGAADLKYEAVPVYVNSLQVYASMPLLSPPSSPSWAMTCPHCDTVTKTYDLLNVQARE